MSKRAADVLLTGTMSVPPASTSTLALPIQLDLRSDSRGDLVFGEIARHIPFAIERFFFITNIAPLATRGHHAHRAGPIALFCIRGAVDLFLDSGAVKERVRLTTPDSGLLIRPRVWHTMENFSSDALVLVLASNPYDEADYIRDYDEFRRGAL